MNPQKRGLLRIPRLADGALGRPRRHRLHRRPLHRRHARSQRPAPRALPGHQGRPHHHGLGDRRAPRQARRRQARRAACSPARCCWSIPWKAASSPTRNSSARSTAAIPTSSGSRKTRSRSTSSPSRRASTAPITTTLVSRQRAFGYTDEDIRMILGPMAEKGEEPIGSMGTDTPLACLSDKPQPLFHYFKQLFAQVTNPPIDPIREEMVMSLTSYIGTERNILAETPAALPHAQAAASHPHQSRSGKAAPRRAGRFPRHHAAHALPRGRGRQGPGARAHPALPPRLARHSIRLHAADPLRPRRRPRLRAHPQPAGADRRAQSPGPRRDPHPGAR